MKKLIKKSQSKESLPSNLNSRFNQNQPERDGKAHSKQKGASGEVPSNPKASFKRESRCDAEETPAKPGGKTTGNNLSFEDPNSTKKQAAPGKFGNFFPFQKKAPTHKDSISSSKLFVKDPPQQALPAKMKPYDSYNDIQVGNVGNLNNFVFKRNMYIINEHPGFQKKQPLNTSINKEVNPEAFGSKTLLNLDSASMQMKPQLKNRTLASIPNFLGKRCDFSGELSQRNFRLSGHPIEGPSIKAAFPLEPRAPPDNVSLLNNNEKNLGAASYLQRSPQYQSYKYLPWKERLGNSKKQEHEPSRKSIFYPADPHVHIKSPLTPDYRKLKKRMSYNQQMNLNLQDFNLSIKAANKSYNCSPFVNHSPMSVFDNIKYLNNFKSIPISNNSIMDLRSDDGSEKIQYSFKETRLLKKNPGSSENNGPLFNRIDALCQKNLKKPSSYMFNPHSKNYFNSFFNDSKSLRKSNQKQNLQN